MSHPTPFTLERLAVEDLPPAEAEAVAAHVRQCADCGAYVASLAALGAERLAAAPPATFVARLAAARRRRRRVPLYAAAGALAAAALLFVVGRPNGVRLKGGGFALERQRDGVVTRLGPDAAVRAGDRLRVVVTAPAPTRAAVWFVDDDGRVDPLLAAPASVPAGAHALPGSMTLDAPCVGGWVVVATGAGASADAEAKLRAAVAGGVARGRDVPPGVPEGARVRRLRCE